MGEKIVNMTPHNIVIVGSENETLRVIEPSGETIRLSQSTVQDTPIGGVPTSRTVYGDPEGLPPKADGVFYVVSQLVKSALPGRSDLLVPAEMVRDEKGQIIGCRSLGR